MISCTLCRLSIPFVFLTLSIFSSNESVGQALFPEYVENAIDSALSSIAMTRYDLGMMHDATGDDLHRLSTIKRLFSDPISSFALSDALAAAALKGIDEPTILAQTLRPLLDLETTFPAPARIVVNDREIGLFGKFDINRLNYTEQLVLRRFVALAIATDVYVARSRNQIGKEKRDAIVEFCDSLILQSEDAGETGLIAMRFEERRSLARAKQFFNHDVGLLDFGQMLSPGIAMYAQAFDYAKKMKPEVPNYYKSVRTSVWETPLGLVAIGGSGDDVYTGDFFCIVDIGGNDVYRASSKGKSMAARKSTSLIVDFGGDDTYLGEDFAFGGTLFGASTLLDLEGDDIYRAKNFSLGCGYFGVGILHDHSGSDRYTGGTAVQGAGLFGIGLLVDRSGNDLYYAHLASQGFGYTRGFGAIVEGGGNDQYVAASPYQDYLRYDDHYESFCQGASLGFRPVASGGIGLIAEGGGNDVYFSDIFGQGTAYWYGLGSIVDVKGNDTYTSFQYAQGSGVHLAFGTLLDKEGNDNYTSHGVSQGCGHDIAFGGLVDIKGDDNFVVESLSLGGGNANAVSLFVDAGGEDAYVARRDNTLGYSDLRRDYGMIGIFLDLDGEDFYGTSRGGNDTTWLGSTYGVGIDGPIKPEEIKLEEEKSDEKDSNEIAKELETELPRLFIQASAAPQKYQYLVEPARKRLELGADSTISFLLTQLDTEHPREALALRVILPRIGNRLTPLLIDTIRNGARSRTGLAAHILGRLKDSAGAMALGELLTDANWRIRSTATEALLKMDAVAARGNLRLALKDSIDLVRGRAARALVRIADTDDFALLQPLLRDRSQIVRNQIALGLKDRGFDEALSSTFLINNIVDPPTIFAYKSLLQVAEKISHAPSRLRLVRDLTADSSPERRADGVRLAKTWADRSLLDYVIELLPKETSSEVLYELYEVERLLNDE